MNFFIGLIAFLICISHSFAFPVYNTEQGLVEGVEHPDYIEFRGIPYAEADRWEEPREPSKHQGILKAHKHGAISMQAGVSLNGGLTGGKVKGSENSQFINIAVSKNRTTKKMPVLLWIHGGAHVMGDGSQSGFYNISRLAREGKMIVASINYRMGPLGYFAHPDLQKEGPLGSTGNYGTLDVIQALKWIQANIENFGGDVNNVTIMGESAGANLVRVLIASPLAKGLFNRAIPLSGPDMEVYLEESLQQSEEMRKALGIRKSKKDLQHFREVPGEELIRQFPMSVDGDSDAHVYRFGPTVDGVVLPKMASQIIADGDHNKVDVMTTATASEMDTLRYAFGKSLPAVVGEKEFKKFIGLMLTEDAAEEALNFYKSQGLPINKDTLMDAMGDAMFLAPKQKISDDLVRHGNQVYRGLFSKEVAVLGAGHGAADLPNIFGWQHFLTPLSYAAKIKKGMKKMDDDWGLFGNILKPLVVMNHMRPSVVVKQVQAERQYAKQIRRYIYNFVHNGDPNISFDGKARNKNAPKWPEYGATGKYLNINHTTAPSSGHRAVFVDFWHDLGERLAASFKRDNCNQLLTQ